jgi:preprotein translocase subunit SecG
MFYLLLVLLILDALLLSVVVLLQAGQGGGLASLGGGNTDTVLGGRQAVTILTKATWWCGGIFLGLSLLLQFARPAGFGSALQEKLRAATPSAPVELPGTAPAAPLTGGDSAAPTGAHQAAPKPATPQPSAVPQAPAKKPATPPPSPQPKQ